MVTKNSRANSINPDIREAIVWRWPPFFIMKHLLLSLSLLALVLVSCKDPLEEATPSVLKVSSEKFADESGVSHEISVKVTSEKAFEVKTGDSEWISASIGERVKDVTPVTIKLETNSGSDSRTATLTVVAGKKSVDITVSQSPIGKLLPVQEIVLTNLKTTEISFRFPDKWTLSCKNADGSPATWFSADAEGGTANVSKTVAFKALSVNLDGEERKGIVVVTLSGAEMIIGITQPVTDLLAPDFGVHNYDGNGASFVYDEFAHQLSLLKKPGVSYDFRIVSPTKNQFIIFSSLPSSMKKGDKVDFHLVQNVLASLDYETAVSAEVVQVDENKAWLLDGEVCYVIKK